jgi:hypothetical protein
MSTRSDDRSDALLREAAHHLAETLAPYGVLTRDRLAELSGASRWTAVGFDGALRWAVDHAVVRRLDEELYEIGSAADLYEGRGHEEEQGRRGPRT